MVACCTENMKLGIDAAKKAGGVVEAVVCYSGDVASKKETKYTLDYYLDFVDKLVTEGIHVLGIKDMAGLLKPESARLCVLFIYVIFPVSKTRLLGSSVLFARSIPTSQSMCTHMIQRVSRRPVCWQPLLQAPMSSMLLSTVSLFPL